MKYGNISKWTMLYDNKLSDQLKSAYRKYKTDIYYNPYSAIQRAELAEFEAEHFLIRIIINLIKLNQINISITLQLIY